MHDSDDVHMAERCSFFSTVQNFCPVTIANVGYTLFLSPPTRKLLRTLGTSITMVTCSHTCAELSFTDLSKSLLACSSLTCAYVKAWQWRTFNMQSPSSDWAENQNCSLILTKVYLVSSHYCDSSCAPPERLDSQLLAYTATPTSDLVNTRI